MMRVINSVTSVVCVFWLLQLGGVDGVVVVASSSSSEKQTGLAQLKHLRRELSDCFKTQNVLWPCLRSRSLKMLDGLMSSDVIPLYDGVRLIAARNPINAQARSSLGDKHEKHATWFDQLAMSLARGLATHTLQINLAELTESLMPQEDATARAHRNPAGTARVRRHRFNMIITMMFGVTALGAVLVPMGFQLLSIVSGKALLLAKMALLLASVNGLKKVANNGLHYGLYHVPNDIYGGYYDRGDMSHGRNVPIPVAVQPAVELGM